MCSTPQHMMNVSSSCHVLVIFHELANSIESVCFKQLPTVFLHSTIKVLIKKSFYFWQVDTFILKIKVLKEPYIKQILHFILLI